MPLSSKGKSLTNGGGDDGEGGGSVPKIGRKGDPRMHKAVAARLANPDLSLFEALKIGGFDYKDDNDPTGVDSENIALGQRKNQLSRRLRLARKSDSIEDDFGASAVAAIGLKMEDAPGGDDQVRKSSSIKAAVKAAAKRGIQGPVASEPDKMAGKKRPTPTSNDTDDSSTNENTSSRSMKEMKELLSRELQRKSEEPALLARAHPDFQHIFVVPRGSAVGLSFSEQKSATHLTANKTPGLNIQDINMANGFTVGGLHGVSLPASKPGSTAPPSVSSVAVRSLNATAKSVGITLEQLALVLSTSKNLMQLLSGLTCEDGNDPDCQQKKRDLALRLHEYESKTLYSRCMLLAGYNHEDASEGDPTQLKFALEAWQKEGKRLQELIRNNTDVMCDDAPLIHNIALTGKETMAASLSSQLSQQKQLQQIQLKQQQQQRDFEQQQRLLQQMQQKLSSLGHSSVLGNALAGLGGEASILGKLGALAGGGGGGYAIGNALAGGDLGALGLGARGNASQLDHLTNQTFRNSSQGAAGSGFSMQQQPDQANQNQRSDVSLGACQYTNGHHVHRLAGRCGHRAILHQPVGGTPHIDFVVGDKIECYGGLQRSPEASADGNAVWPSRYKCEELDCSQAEQCSKAYTEEYEHNLGCTTGDGNKAKILDVDNVDFDSDEWTLDFNDEVLMSLFSLGNTTGSDQSSARSGGGHKNNDGHNH